MIKYFALLLLISFAIAQAKSGDGKIAGGVPFSIFMAPFQVGVLKNGGGFCGGSIIGPTWILSSAHCLENKAKDSFVVSAGTADLHVPIVIRNVKNIIVHPEFNTTVYLNFDIALLNLDQKLVYSRSIIPIKLVDQNQILTPGTLCKITGWGQSNITIVPDTHLRGTYVELASYECCMSNWGTGITRSMLCTGPLNGQQMSCGGDGGGPLTTYITGTITQIGIVSFGPGCLVKGTYSVYTNISSVRTWITANSGI